ARAATPPATAARPRASRWRPRSGATTSASAWRAPPSRVSEAVFVRRTVMPREPIPTWFFALVVVRQGDEFLVVRERKHGQLWYLPAGRAEPGETLAEAARRETLEETGVPVVLEGLLRLEHTPMDGAARVRALFLARPADDTPPKAAPDEHSLEAAWVTLAGLD